MPTKIKRIILKKKPGELGPNGRPAHWSPEQKEEAVAKWMLLGNLREVQRQTQIPEVTLRKWKSQDWWHEKCMEFRKQANLELEGKLGRVLEKSLNGTLDRLENGELHYNPKTGKMIRHPVKAVVLNQINKTMLDKKFMLDRINRQQDTGQEQVADRLEALKKSFLDFAKKKAEPLTIDITPTEVTNNA